MIDLHAHTTASDGTFSPRQLVQHAHELKLKAIAITDHDTISAWDEASETGRELGIEVVPGIEFSVEGEFAPGQILRFHLLGYYLNPDAPLLQEVLPQLQTERANRNERIIERLNDLKYEITLDEVRTVAGEAQIGRPHIAQVLIEKKYFSDTQAVFDTLLATGKPAALPKKVLAPRDAIEGIHQAGGVAIWAHPPFDRKNRSWDEFEAILKIWLDWGLDGLETFYPTYNEEETRWTAQMARKYKLIGSGGSDFHGARKPNQLGRVQIPSGVPDDVLKQIQASVASFKAVLPGRFSN